MNSPDNSSPKQKGKFQDIVVEPVLPYKSVMTRYKDNSTHNQVTYLQKEEINTLNNSFDLISIWVNLLVRMLIQVKFRKGLIVEISDWD